MEDNKSIRDNIIKEFKKYNFIEGIYRELYNYLDKKDNYIKNQSDKDYVDMLMSYDVIFTSLKSEKSFGRINYNDLNHLNDMLKEGLG